MTFVCRTAGVSLRQFGHLEGPQSRATALLCQKEPVEVDQSFHQDASLIASFKGFQTSVTPWGGPGTHWRNSVSIRLSNGLELENVAGRETSGLPWLTCCHHDLIPDERLSLGWELGNALSQWVPSQRQKDKHACVLLCVSTKSDAGWSWIVSWTFGSSPEFSAGGRSAGERGRDLELRGQGPAVCGQSSERDGCGFAEVWLSESWTFSCLLPLSRSSHHLQENHLRQFSFMKLTSRLDFSWIYWVVWLGTSIK